LAAADGKKYKTDVIDDKMYQTLMLTIRSPRKDSFQKWMASVNSSLDEKSKLNNPLQTAHSPSNQRIGWFKPPFFSS
jgi:hypothetical protein